MPASTASNKNYGKHGKNYAAARQLGTYIPNM